MLVSAIGMSGVKVGPTATAGFVGAGTFCITPGPPNWPKVPDVDVPIAAAALARSESDAPDWLSADREFSTCGIWLCGAFTMALPIAAACVPTTEVPSSTLVSAGPTIEPQLAAASRFDGVEELITPEGSKEATPIAGPVAASPTTSGLAAALKLPKPTPL